MPTRFRRTFKILPGLKINLSKSGFSTSLGGRGFSINVGKRGVRQTTGLPGTGLSFTKIVLKPLKFETKKPKASTPSRPIPPPDEQPVIEAPQSPPERTAMDRLKTFWKASRRNKVIAIVIAALLLICLCCIGSFALTSVMPQPPTTTPTIIPTITPTATITPTPVPSPTLTADQHLRQLVETALGPGNRDVPRLGDVTWDPASKVIAINWAINDNLTVNLVVTSSQMDVINMLKAVAQSSIPYDYQEIAFAGSFSMVDPYGNESEDIVVRAIYTRQTIQKINWQNLLTENIFFIADSFYAHPDFK